MLHFSLYIYIYIFFFWDFNQHNDVGLFVLDGNVFIKIKNTTTLFDNEMMSLNIFLFEKQTLTMSLAIERTKLYSIF